MKNFKEFLNEKQDLNENLPLPDEKKLGKWFKALPQAFKDYILDKKMTAIDMAELYIVIAIENGKSTKDAFDEIYFDGAFEKYKKELKKKMYH